MEVIKGNAFLQKFSDTQEKLFEMARKIRIAYYPERDYVLRQGDYGSEFFMVLSGQVQMLKDKKGPGGQMVEEPIGFIN